VLARIVQVDARYALQHQALVMQCLEHVDPTIQAKVSRSTTQLFVSCDLLVIRMRLSCTGIVCGVGCSAVHFFSQQI